MPIDCIYFTPEIRVYRNGNIEKFNKFAKIWSLHRSSQHTISIKGKSINKKALYKFCYDIDKYDIIKYDNTNNLIDDHTFLRLNDFYCIDYKKQNIL